MDPVADAELIRDIDVFNRQEAQHYKTHEQFNEIVVRSGYPEFRVHEDSLKAEYDEWVRTKDLEWLLRYCEAFESTVAVGAGQWVDYGWGDFMLGADDRVVELWRWHLAEEYEHRTVVHRVFHRVCTGSPGEVYDKRIEGLNSFLEHLQRVITPLRAYLLGVDRAAMSREERAISEEREAEVDAANERSFAPVADVMSPSWDPATLPAPRELDQVLERYS
jgi:predicted metal-dependent hydrolase